MNSTFVALSDGHWRAPSPEYWPSRISYTPCTETHHLHRCLPSTALLKQHFHSHSLRRLDFAPANISKHFCCIPVIFLYMTLDGLMTVESLPPALVILPSGTLIVLLPALTPARYCFCLCFASDTPDTVIWPLPVWPWSRLLKWICKWIHMLLIRHYRRLRLSQIRQPFINSPPRSQLRLPC